MGRAEVHGSSSGGGTSSLGYLLGGDSYSPSSRPPTRPTYDSYEEEAAPQPSPHHQQQRQQQPVMLSAQHGQVEYYADAGEALGWAGSDDVTVGQIFPPEMVSKMTLPELRVQLRSRGCSPAGGKQTLVERLNDAIALEMHGREQGMQQAHRQQDAPPPMYYEPQVAGGTPPSNVNNYTRQSGQNCDNFISDRPSSRVLAPPGGNSSFSFNGQ